MTSKGAIKWLARLERPRCLDSLISEVYGEATIFGCLLEREVADLLNFYEMGRDPLQAILNGEFNTEDWTLNVLLKELAKRKIPDEQLSILQDGKEARNELVHRLIATKLVVSRADKELMLAQIDALYFRIWKAHRLARDLKKHFAGKLGVSEDRINDMIKKKQEEARIEDENIRQILGHGPDEPAA